MGNRIQNSLVCLIFILTVIWGIGLMFAVWSAFKDKIDESIVEKSNEEWTVVEVYEKVESVSEDNSLTKYVIIDTHGQLDFSRVYIHDTDLYEDLKVGDLLKLKVEADRISEVREY